MILTRSCYSLKPRVEFAEDELREDNEEEENVFYNQSIKIVQRQRSGSTCNLLIATSSCMTHCKPKYILTYLCLNISKLPSKVVIYINWHFRLVVGIENPIPERDFRGQIVMASQL